MFLWILIALAILFFVYGGVGNEEGFCKAAGSSCTSGSDCCGGCCYNSTCNSRGCSRR